MHHLVVGREERVRRPGLARTARAANAVDIVLDRERKRDVDDVLDVGDVEAARRNVRRDEQWRRALLEPASRRPFA